MHSSRDPASGVVDGHVVGPVVGHVVGLWRYPVKSMASESLRKVEVGWHGFAGDRRWAFIRSDVEQSGFPWLTLRERGDLNRYAPSFVEADRPDKSQTFVRTPSGSVFDVTDRLLAEEIYPHARVIKQDRGVFDTFPLSLITTQTIEQLGNSVGRSLELGRFRTNILVDAPSPTPFPEDSWVRRLLRTGGLTMRVDKRDGRCAIITIDPLTGERTPEILRAVARDRQGCLGVYGTTVEPGSIAVGDPVILL